MFLILPLCGISQTSYVSLEIDLLREASVLIIERDECYSAQEVKDAQIENKQAQIESLESININLEEALRIKDLQINLSDSVINEKIKQIQERDKVIKKQKRTMILGSVGIVLLILII